jgi:hypothetical protein
MGQAKRRGTYEDRVKQADQSMTFQHKGIDLFFKNISTEDLDHLAGVLNSLKRTMNGHTLVWKSNLKYNAVTCFYPETPFTMKQSVDGLMQNRMLGESLARIHNEEKNTDIIYDGSEFYLTNFDNKDQMKIFTKEINKIKETA